MERIKNILDDIGIKNDIKENYALIEFWTDKAGQDIPVEIDYDGTANDLVKQFTEYAERYDPDEEVALYINCLGKDGVPDTVRELLSDCEEAKETLMMIAEELNKIWA